MTCPKNYSVLWLLTLCTSPSLFAYIPQAQAEVFEVGANGQWQQIGQKGEISGEMLVGEFGVEPSGLPPVRLAAITTIDAPDQPTQAQVISPAPVTGQYAPLINAAAQQYGISPALVEAVMWQESRYNHRAVSSAGAIGLMQLMPGTAHNLGVNPHDPWQNVFGGAAYLRKQLDLFNNNVPFALAAYNAGPGAVIKHGGVPPYAETRNYVSVIMRRLMKQEQ
jgi:hypothetical protein